MERLTLEQTLFNMWTENTGTHLLDSGGAYGRNWQRNQKKTIEDFNNQKTATLTLELSKGGDLYCYGYASTWHHLNATLELDDICHRFNALPCDNWDGEAAYGLSAEGEDYLQGLNAEFEQPWNTYNWDNNWDQTLQGCNLKIDGESYVLIQYHGGCDVRGGYTDAKLFKIGYWMEDYFIYGDNIYGPHFEEIDNGFDLYSCDLVDHNTGTQFPDELKQYIIDHYKLEAGGDSVEIEAFACEY